jgi:hypothetical protein
VKKVRTGLPLHPFLLVAYFFAFLYANNPGRVQLGILALPFALALGGVAALYFLFFRGTRDARRAALLTSLLVLLFFAYGHAYGVLYAWLLSMDALLLHLLLTQGVLAVLLVGQVAIRRARDLTSATFAAHVMAGLLLVMVSVPLLSKGLRGDAGFDGVSSATTPQSEAAAHDEPDIYLIILDSYARQDILERHYGFDNRLMLDSLVSLGFQVVPQSRSNYAWTHLTIPSLLNMRYLDELASGRHEHGMAPRRANALAQRNEVVDLLRRFGYYYIHFSSTYGSTRRSPIADEEVQCRGGVFDEEGYRALVESTWLRVLDFAVANDLARCHLSQFEQLERSAARPSPKFVFAHFIPPHHPYLFDRDGRVLRRATIANQMRFQDNLWADRAGYLEQLRFVNKRVLGAIEGILEGSDRTPVIVVMSDHGPQLPGTDTETLLKARFANFTAMLLPGATGLAVPGDLTPVNVFRLILGEYLGLDLPLLPNHHVFSTFQDPYAFTDVTSVLASFKESVNASSVDGNQGAP